MFDGSTTLVEGEDRYLDVIGNEGERAVVNNTWSFWAHLSIYRFALPFTTGKRVFDAGSGSGYGSAYLAHNGADVTALDAGAEAVAHARKRYAGLPVTYDVADFNKPLPLGSQQFDTVFSSNVFEHVGNIDSIVAESARVLKTDGTAIIAVPPIINADVMEEDIRNHFHVHHFLPGAWQAKLERFFESVQCHSHVGAGAFENNEIMIEESKKPVDQVTIREMDFAFPESQADDLVSNGTITAVYVCRRPRANPLPETIVERTPAAWCESAVAARIIGEERAKAAELLRIEREVAAPLRKELEGGAAAIAEVRSLIAAQRADLQAKVAEVEQACAATAAAVAQVEAIKASRSWKVTQPLRWLGSLLRGRT